ncbi:Muscle M-line assembly protein unc-89, putative isoform 1 [Hibiscus syriacus]|uniref:RING-type E3 ubiquitin transferase n=1 Tax=Hibiscus syriacus TaxID=106335 RepID=A0A6A3BTV1_HIBSY|nr:Muscle M-line assembly protein unc-89, putative isoform 1 [Hibiscus syriacus]
MLSVIWVSTASLMVVVSGCYHFYNKWIESSSRDVEYCVVCISEVSKGEKLGWLRCGHGFHDGCIDAWLKVGTTCPICRVNVVPKRSFLVSSMVSRAVKWIQNPLSSEITLAFCESVGYV